MKKHVRLAFFGSKYAFDYHNIGGTDSIVRRLGHAITDHPIALVKSIALVTYGHEIDSAEQHSAGLSSFRFVSFEHALSFISKMDHVIAIYLPVKDRIRFGRFRLARRSSKTHFHMLFQSWPDSPLRRQMMFMDARLFPFNGCLFGVSDRITKSLCRFHKNTTRLLPPVPEAYYMSPNEKKRSDKLRVVFLGRVDPGKGVPDVFHLMNVLTAFPDIELAFYGMHWPHKPESVELHKQLSTQQCFPYIDVDFRGYDPAVEDMVGSVLRKTDIFLQPYHKLSSTIDAPVLVLEAMSALAAVMTKPLGEIPALYGESRCLIDSDDFVNSSLNRIRTADQWLPSEQQRIYQQTEALAFDTQSVADRFIAALELSPVTDMI